MADPATTTSSFSDLVAAAPYVAAVIAATAAFAAAKISHSAKISEFRQAWINELRKDMADFVGAANKWFRMWEQVNAASGEEKHKLENDKLSPIANETRVVLWRIRMRLNPRDNAFKTQDDELLQSLDALLNPGKIDPTNPEAAWLKMADSAVSQARDLLKREWEVTKRVPWFWRK